jgi:hypothetical protein
VAVIERRIEPIEVDAVEVPAGRVSAGHGCLVVGGGTANVGGWYRARFGAEAAAL